MTSGRFLDSIDGGQRNRAQWPVACWKSPSLNTAPPTELVVPSPIPPNALVDYSSECVVANTGYSVGDQIRVQRAVLGGANDHFHPAWIAAKQSMVLLSGNLANSSYYSTKTTGVNALGGAANWNNRLFGAWPLLRGGGIHQRPSQRTRADFKAGGVTKILRRRAETPWVRGTGVNGNYVYDLRNLGHSDEPAFIQLWGRCLSPDLGYQVGQETPIRGIDSGGASAGGDVFYNGSRVGFCMASVGFGGINAVTAAVGNFSPTKWLFQLRVAFASDMDDLLDPRMHRGRGAGIVSFWSSPWMNTPKAVPTGHAPLLCLPENFNPIDINIVIRAKAPTVTTSLWNAGDQIYSMSAGYLGYASWQNFVVDGRRITLPWADGLVYIFRSGAGAATYLYASYGQLEFQLRAIG